MTMAYNRDDFTGEEGPGLARLRAARARPEEESKGAALARRADARRKSSAQMALAQAMTEGRWEDAILIAAKWTRGDEHDAAIHRGREAIQRPAFQRQLKRDPAQMIAEAKEALLQRYGSAK